MEEPFIGDSLCSQPKFPNFHSFGEQFFVSTSEDEKVSLIERLLNQINFESVEADEQAFVDVLDLILPFTYPLQNEPIRKASLS